MHPEMAYHMIEQTAEERRRRATEARLADSLPRRKRSIRLGRYRLTIDRIPRGSPRPI